LAWLLGEFCVALGCVFRAGKGFVVLEGCWLVERSFAWLLGCRRLVRCDAGLCEVEACWVEWACVRWFVRRLARGGNARQSLKQSASVVGWVSLQQSDSSKI
jgi:hypothetical protein